MNSENNYIKTFYDNYSDHLNKTGYNFRHYHIGKWLDRFGIEGDNNVLEIGCGPGHSTTNLINRIDKGRIIAVDISSENIRMAKELHGNCKNVDFFVSDMSNFKHELKFDLVVLPDVLEHIPIDQHHELFKTIRSHLKDDGMVMIHIPDPERLEFDHRTNKANLQIIDQPIHTEILGKNLKNTGLRITFLESYSSVTEDYDYQAIKLEPNGRDLSTKSKVWDRSIKSRIRRRMNMIMGRRSFE